MRILSSMIFIATAVMASAEEIPSEIPVKLVQITLSQEADLALSEAGRLSEVSAEEGKQYDAGEILSRLDDEEAELLVSRARAELSIAEAEAESDINIRLAKATEEVAKARLRRGELAFERYKNSISEEKLDEDRLAVKEAELRIEQAQHEHQVAKLTLEIKRSELKLAEVQLEKKRTRAPFPGIVVQVNGHQGEWIEQGTAVVRIVRLDRLKVQGFIGAEHLPASVQGRKVKIEIPRADGTAITLESTVAFVSPEVNPINKQRPVWAEIDNKSLLLSPGMKAEMTILTGNASAQTE